MPGDWHNQVQELFSDIHQELQCSITHHSPYNRATKRARFTDVRADESTAEYEHIIITIGKLDNRVIGVINCTENTAKPHKISENEDDEETWLLEFEKEWHVKSMRDCKILFASFRDADGGMRMFRIPIESVRNRMVLVFGEWAEMTKWKRHVISEEMDIDDFKRPIQSTLTVQQDPPGSGKTYNLTRMMIHTDLPQYNHCAAYSTFIVLTKIHSAKEVVFTEFISQLEEAGIESDTRTSPDEKKYIVNFKRPTGAEIMCIFGTVDSLLYNMAYEDKRIKGTDMFVRLVKTINEFGPTKLQGPKGRADYAREQPRMNKKTLLVTDEATMVPASYVDAFATLMGQCHVDVHLAGDVQQSTGEKDNMLTRVVSEYNEGKVDLPSFPGCRVEVRVGREIRRFNQALVDFRNKVMEKFHTNPTHNLQIPQPVAAGDVTHVRGDHFVHKIQVIRSSDDRDSNEVQDAVGIIMEKLEQDVWELKLLPNEILIVSPHVRNNPLLDEVQTYIQEFWNKTFSDEEYVRLLETKTADETEDVVTARMRRHDSIKKHLEETTSSLEWFCVLHRGERGKVINTAESKYGTRIVSIHSSQGDGRKVAYVVGLSEKRLTMCTNGKIDLVYESLLNVSVSRMKELIRVFLEPTYDDIWERFLPFIPEEMKQDVPPELDATKKLRLNGAWNCDLDLDEELFHLTKDKIVAALPRDDDRVAQYRPVVDFSHHIIRMAAAHTIFWAHVIAKQAKEGSNRQQVITVFNKVANAKIETHSSKEYYNALRRLRDRRNWDIKETKSIPVLEYSYATKGFESAHTRILVILKQVQDFVQQWLQGKHEFEKFTPEHAVLLQYAVDLFSPHGNDDEDVKIDHVYNVVRSHIVQIEEDTERDLKGFYKYLTHMTSMFQHVVGHANEEPWEWKINRAISLGNKRTGKPTKYFQFNTNIRHLFLPGEERAIPIILCATIDNLNMARTCTQALLYTLICIQPEENVIKSDEKKGTFTWEYIKDKRIEICLVPIQSSRPIFIDLTEIVEKKITAIADWICRYTRKKAEGDILQAQKFADYYSEFEEAQFFVSEEHGQSQMPDYILEAFNEAKRADEVPRLLHQKLECHLDALLRNITARARR